MMSYFASGNYNYDNKYYLSASFRRDGSSRLSEDNRWASFWSVSGAWRMSKEGFMQDMPLFTDFKIKATCPQITMVTWTCIQVPDTEVLLLFTGQEWQTTN